MLGLKTILHPTDFSPSSEHAFHLACALARDYGGRVIVVHVKAPAETVVGEFGMMPPVPADDAELQAKLNLIQPPDPGVPLVRHLVTGNPADQILSMAQEIRCDLIVIGTHGRTGLAHLLMGGVAEQVVRQARCPVLTVKTPASRTPIS